MAVARVLDALPITTAVTGAASAAVPCGTGPVKSLAIVVDFAWGSGGTSGKVWVQSSFDGVSFFDVACMTFTTASKSRLHNLTNAPMTTPYALTDGTLADDTAKNSLLGTIYRTKLTTIGTYAGGTTLTVSVIPQS